MCQFSVSLAVSYGPETPVSKRALAANNIGSPPTPPACNMLLGKHVEGINPGACAMATLQSVLIGRDGKSLSATTAPMRRSNFSCQC